MVTYNREPNRDCKSLLAQTFCGTNFHKFKLLHVRHLMVKKLFVTLYQSRLPDIQPEYLGMQFLGTDIQSYLWQKPKKNF